MSKRAGRLDWIELLRSQHSFWYRRPSHGFLHPSASYSFTPFLLSARRTKPFRRATRTHSPHDPRPLPPLSVVIVRHRCLSFLVVFLHPLSPSPVRGAASHLRRVQRVERPRGYLSAANAAAAAAAAHSTAAALLSCCCCCCCCCFDAAAVAVTKPLRPSIVSDG